MPVPPPPHSKPSCKIRCSKKARKSCCHPGSQTPATTQNNKPSPQSSPVKQCEVPHKYSAGQPLALHCKLQCIGVKRRQPSWSP